MTSSDDGLDVESRQAAVDSARASVQAEDLVPSEAFEADALAYVAGEITDDELVERAERRFRREPAP